MQQPMPSTAAEGAGGLPPEPVATALQPVAVAPATVSRPRSDRRSTKSQRPEKTERKASRRASRPAVASDAPGSAAVLAASHDEASGADLQAAQFGTGVPLESGLETAADGPSDARTPAAPADDPATPALALASGGTPTMLVAPLVDTSSGQKIVERTRAQFHAAESAVAGNAEVISVIAPLIRHVNGVTEQLNDAQINLGRLMAERDALRQQLADLQGVDVAQISLLPVDSTLAAGERHGSRLQRIENRAAEPAAESSAKFRVRNPLKVDALATREEMARVARRRQLLAIALFGGVGLLLFMNSRQGNDISKVSRDSLADLQFVGIFFNMFFMVWMLYRVVRVGGKGAKWLFPQNTGNQRRH